MDQSKRAKIEAGEISQGVKAWEQDPSIQCWKEFSRDAAGSRLDGGARGKAVDESA